MDLVSSFGAPARPNRHPTMLNALQNEQRLPGTRHSNSADNSLTSDISMNSSCSHRVVRRYGRERRWRTATSFRGMLLLVAVLVVIPSQLRSVSMARKVAKGPSDHVRAHFSLENQSPCTLDVFWVNPDNGQKTKMSSSKILPGGSFSLDSYEGHKFEIRNVHSKCCGGSKSSECRRNTYYTMTSQRAQVMYVRDGLELVQANKESDDDEEDEEEDYDEEGRGRRTGRHRLTTHAKTNRKTLIDLHSTDLDANADLELGIDDPNEAAKQVMERIGANLQGRIAKIFEKAKTAECRALIGEHFGYFINAIGTEESLPFADVGFENECDEERYDFDNLPEGMHFGHIQNRTYQPPKNETEYVDEADLKLCYAIMTHDDANATIRLIEALYEDGHIFVVHVDGKSDQVHDKMVEYASTRDYVHVLQHPYRVRVNWGGFTMVNATMQMLKYAFAIDQIHNEPLDFHKFVHLASTTYPIASNAEIRRRIASFPLDANLMNIIMKPANIHPANWHYFVECDDAVHRIYRLQPMGEWNDSIDIYTSSQWFIISKEFAKYLAEARPGTLVHEFLEYAQHVVVSDEAFFGTVLRNTPFCHKHHNWNFLHLQFDRWESELEQGKRDERKCLMPSPDHCGRSPTTMTTDYMDVLELSEDLFARKFLDSADSKIKDVLDMKRAKEEKEIREGKDPNNRVQEFDHAFAGHGVLIVAKETVNDDMPLCLGLGDTQNKARLVPCFYDWVPDTLAPGWETGAVVTQETILHNRWELGPCSSDGALERMPTGEMNMTPGLYSPVGPRCMLKQMDGIRAGRCMDGESERTQPGGDLQVYPCLRRWHQFLSFGNGTLTPAGSMHLTIPRYIVKTIRDAGKDQEAYLCLGVHGRGNMDEDGWEEDRISEDNDKQPYKKSSETDTELLPLSEWVGEQVITTRCSNANAVVSWLYVPFIVEEWEESNESLVDSSKDGDTPQKADKGNEEL